MEGLSKEDQTLVQAAINAVTIQLSAHATPEERLNAGTYCENLKRDENGLRYAFLLMHPSLEGHVRMYGMSILEYYVKHGWEEEEGRGGGGMVKGGGFAPATSADGCPILTSKQKMSVQSSVLNMLAMGMRDMLEEEVYLKEKACVVVCEMAKRSWPAEWPYLLTDLIGASGEAVANASQQTFYQQSSFVFQHPHLFSSPTQHNGIASIGPSQAELVITFFKILAEELASPLCDIPNSKRKMLIHSLTNACRDTIFPYFYNQLDYFYGEYQRLKQGWTDEHILELLPGGALGPGSKRAHPPHHNHAWQSSQPSPHTPSPQQAELQTCLLLIHAILQALVAFAEWVKIEVFMESGSNGAASSQSSGSKRGGQMHTQTQTESSPSYNLASVVVLFLSEAPFRVRAAELLLVMESRPRPDRDAMIFLFDHMPLIADALATVPPGVVVDDVQRSGRSHNVASWHFSRRLSQVLCLLGQIHLDFLNLSKPPPHLDLFMSLMLNIAAHPSLQLCTLASAFWKRLVSLPLFQRQDYYIPTCETLLGNMAWAFVKWRFDTMGEGICPPEVHFFRQLDFEDDEDTYIVFQAENRGMLSKTLIVPIALAIPATAISFANFQWQQCISLYETLYAAPTAPSQDALQALVAMFESAAHLIATVNENLSPATLGAAYPPSPTPDVAALFQKGRGASYYAKAATAGASGSQNRKKKSKSKSSGNNKSDASLDTPLLQSDPASQSLILEVSTQIFSSLISFDSGLNAVTVVQIEACKSFLSYFFCVSESLDALLQRLMSLVTFSGSDEAVLQAVASAQAAYESGDVQTCHSEMTRIFGPNRGSSGYGTISQSVRSVRRRACTALISIGSKIPTAMVGHLPHILGMVADWTNRGMLQSQEIVLVMDWVSSLSNVMNPPSEQQSFLFNLISPQVSQWQQEAYSLATSSPAALFSFAGVPPSLSNRQRKLLSNNTSLSPFDPSIYSDTPPHLIPANPPTAAANRDAFIMILHSLESVWRRVHNWSSRLSQQQQQGGDHAADLASTLPVRAPTTNLEKFNFVDSNPLSEFDLAILGNLLRLIACLHQMWSEDVKERYGESCKAAYELSQSMVSSWLRTNRHQNGSGGGGDFGGSGGDAMMYDGGGGGGMMSDGGGGLYDGVGDVWDAPLSDDVLLEGHNVESPYLQRQWNGFFSSLRGYSYATLGFLIAHQSPFWTDSPDLLDSFAGAILVNIECAHPYDLAMLLKRVVTPTIRTCPPHAFEHLQRILVPFFDTAGSLVSKLYKSKAEKEKAAAEAVAARAASTRGGISAVRRSTFEPYDSYLDDDENGSSEQEEIVLDRSIVELLNAVAATIQLCVLRSHSGGVATVVVEEGAGTQETFGFGFGGGAGAGGFPSATQFGNSAPSHSSSSHSPMTYVSPLSDLFIALMRQGNGAVGWLLNCVNDIFAWNEATSTRRMCNVLTQIVEGLKEAQEERMFAIGPVAASSSVASSATPKRGKANHMMSITSHMSVTPQSSAPSASDINAQQAQLLQEALEKNPMLPPEDASTYQLLTTASFKSVLLALHSQSENAGMLVTLARELWELDPALANATLLEIPNITTAILNKFSNDMSHQSTEKGKSGVMRELLEKVAGWDLTPAAHTATHATRILDVPAPLFALHVAKRQKAAKEKQALDDHAQLGLASLFATP